MFLVRKPFLINAVLTKEKMYRRRRWISFPAKVLSLGTITNLRFLSAREYGELEA